MGRCYIYVVDRDFGFAPNPFHGVCTLATCKPNIRGKAEVGDWVIGVGGRRLKATGRCIFAMQVSEITTFNRYWRNPLYFDKRPVRNGSSRMMVGDNIYYLDAGNQKWNQADSHHSNPDGSINRNNLRTDTKTNRVLISRQFIYFGRAAPMVPRQLLAEIGYKNSIGHRVFPLKRCERILDWLMKMAGSTINSVVADPYDFEISGKRYSGVGNKVI